MAAAENLLRLQTSPYLLQHADNPVHWRPWGPDALAEARATNRPILLSIGYAACHWCHVMAHESFENPETAALMNSLYVNIKVDREERPDIDALYMSALHALGEQGGWPLTMFLTPDGDPFWGGTYFPPEPRWGRPSFHQVLNGVAEAYHGQADAIRQNVTSLRQTLAATSATHPGASPQPEMLDHAAASLLRVTDPMQGGLQGAPKFPNPSIFRFLWQNAFRTGQRPGIDATRLLLTRMSQGGIYDHLGGGYSRYSTDAEWLVPHFEKMLYDNAQLLELLAFAHAEKPDPLYAERAAETVGWMVRDMTAETVNGLAAFAASEDADSDGEEGRFYVWTESEIDALLGADSPPFRAAYDVHARGNWEGNTILRRMTPPGDDRSRTGAVTRQSCSLPAPTASAPAATTRCWPTGTASPSPPSPAPPPCSANPRGSPAPPRRSTSSSPACPARAAASSTPGASAASPPPACSTTRPPWPAPRSPSTKRPARPNACIRPKQSSPPRKPGSPTPAPAITRPRRMPPTSRSAPPSARARPPTTPPPTATA